MKTTITIVLLSLTLTVRSESVLSPGDGHWGTWTQWSSCPKLSYARSVRLRFESKQGGAKDDSGLNSVQIKCEDIYGIERRVLKPHDGYDGDWSKFSNTTCKSFIKGVSIEIFGKGGLFSDARGATNLKVVCSDGTVLRGRNDDKSGTWGDTKYCNSNMAICGIKVRMGGSSTALNGAKFQCCDLPNSNAYPFNLPSVSTTIVPATKRSKSRVSVNNLRSKLSGNDHVIFPNDNPSNGDKNGTNGNNNAGDSKPIPRNDSSKSSNSEEIIGISIGIILFLVIVGAMIVVIKKKRRKKHEEILEEVNMRYDVEDAEEKINMIRPESFLK